jgi:hypothetical protein
VAISDKEELDKVLWKKGTKKDLIFNIISIIK